MPEAHSGRSEQISFDQVGCEARMIPAWGEIFFLTSSFIALATPAGWLYEPETPAETLRDLRNKPLSE